MARSLLLMASSPMLKGPGQAGFLKGPRSNRLSAEAPQSRVHMQAGPAGGAQSSKLVSDQIPELLAGGEQLMSIAGVNTQDPRLSLAISVATQASRKIEQGRNIISTGHALSSAAPFAFSGHSLRFCHQTSIAFCHSSSCSVKRNSAQTTANHLCVWCGLNS